MSNTCDICIENINARNYAITCIGCDFVCCKTCFKRYACDPAHYFQCMSCNIEYDRASLSQRLGASFMRNEYKHIREAMLFEEEKSLFPATQLVLEKEAEIERLRLQLSNIGVKYDKLRAEKVQELNAYINSDAETTVRDAVHQYITLNEATIMDDRIHDESQELERKIVTLSQSKDSVKKTFIRKCAQTDCNGMLSTENRTPLDNYMCIVCRSVSCAECREIISNETDHKCNQETLDTVKFIEESSKPCPSCASPIHKTEGCFDKHTIIPLINGVNKCAHEIDIGDQLIGDDLQPRTVLQTFSGRDMMYQVSQEHGDPYVVNSKHNLVMTKLSGSVYVIDLTTYLQLSPSQQDELYGYKIDAVTGKRVLSKLTIKQCKVNQYYGFVIDGNSKFLYTDGTVLSNCDQMFCTACHTAFSWKTLRIATGAIHNPYYFAWMREQGAQDRNPLDIRCGQEVDHNVIVACQKATVRILGPPLAHTDDIKSMNERFNQLLQKIPHVHRVSIPRHQGVNRYARNQGLRLQLLRKRISDAEFKMKIQRTDKAESKKRDILNILITFRDAASDITFRMVERINRGEYTRLDDFGQFYTELNNLSKYMRVCLINVATAYGSNMSVDIMDY